MMRKFLGLVLAMFVGATVQPSAAQQRDKVFRLGYLTTAEPAADAPRAGAIRAALRALGYVEGQNIVIEYRSSQGLTARLPELAADLVRFKVDLIIAAGGDGVIVAAKNATTTIPVVMVGQGSDPVEAGIVASLAHPGGNVTGFISISSDLAGKRVELLKETVPKLSRLAILHVVPSRAAEGHVRETEIAARALGLRLQLLGVKGPADVENAFQDAWKQRAEALIVVRVAGMSRYQPRIVNLTIKSRLPTMYTQSSGVIEGGLMSYAADVLEIRRRAATYVDKILKGTKPSELPVQQPTKFELVINLKTAKQIGLTIPPNVLARADKVIR
jgi:putative ABC transport system substrate-binding protein